MSNGSNKGIPPNVRKTMLAEEFGDGDGEVTDVPVEAMPAAVLETVEAPGFTAPPSMATPPPADMGALIQALITGLTQSNAQTADAIREALGSAAAMARDPIPENKVDPGKSVYSHPDGDLVHPRTKLHCPMFLGLYDDEGMVKPAFEIFEDVCTEDERIALNQVQPGVYPGITRNDGISATWRVVQKRDDNGAPTRLIIAVPQTWLAPDQFQHMPGQPQFLAQLVAGAKAAAA